MILSRRQADARAREAERVAAAVPEVEVEVDSPDFYTPPSPSPARFTAPKRPTRR